MNSDQAFVDLQEAFEGWPEDVVGENLFRVNDFVVLGWTVESAGGLLTGQVAGGTKALRDLKTRPGDSVVENGICERGIRRLSVARLGKAPDEDFYWDQLKGAGVKRGWVGLEKGDNGIWMLKIYWLM